MNWESNLSYMSLRFISAKMGDSHVCSYGHGGIKAERGDDENKMPLKFLCGVEIHVLILF